MFFYFDSTCGLPQIGLYLANLDEPGDTAFIPNNGIEEALMEMPEIPGLIVGYMGADHNIPLVLAN